MSAGWKLTDIRLPANIHLPPTPADTESTWLTLSSRTRRRQIDSRQLQRLEVNLQSSDVKSANYGRNLNVGRRTPRWPLFLRRRLCRRLCRRRASVPCQPYVWGDYNTCPSNLPLMEEAPTTVAPPWAAPSTVIASAPPAK